MALIFWAIVKRFLIVPLERIYAKWRFGLIFNYSEIFPQHFGSPIPFIWQPGGYDYFKTARLSWKLQTVALKQMLGISSSVARWKISQMICWLFIHKISNADFSVWIQFNRKTWPGNLSLMILSFLLFCFFVRPYEMKQNNQQYHVLV